MTLPKPNLDDRTFDDLMAAARARIEASRSDWSDLSESDPGITLIEVFAHLTELMLFRMNRLPDKAYVAFLDLLGVQPHPASASYTDVLVTLDAPRDSDWTLPAGSGLEAASDGENTLRFETLDAVTIAAGETEAFVIAAHCQHHRGELLGRSNGEARQRFEVVRRPLLALDLPRQSLIVGVSEPSITGDTTIEHDGTSYVVWREVPRFSPETVQEKVYRVDRVSGEIHFAPDLRLEIAESKIANTPRPLAAIPPEGADIRVWYRTLGTGNGRLAANQLTTLNPAVPGVTVTNPRPSVAGRAAETLEHALERGPMALHSLERAITARDFETLARLVSPGVNRATAMADAQLWAHGTPGTVRVTLVPELAENNPASLETLREAEHESVRLQVTNALGRRRALGTTCVVGWAQYKPVSVRLTAELFPGQDASSITSRIQERLSALITPLNTGGDRRGWAFGRSLYSWDVLRTIGDLPGVAGLSNIRLCVNSAPDTDVTALCRDGYQTSTWYASQGDSVFRSVNDARSWEISAQFPDQEVVLVKAYTPTSGDNPDRAGLLCAVTKSGESTRLHLSRDCGTTFEQISQFQFEVTDMGWIFRDQVASLLIASKTGLFELSTQQGAAPRQLLVDPKAPQMGISSLAISRDLQGGTFVAVCGTGEEGVYVSAHGGQSETFSHAGLSGELVRVLMIQHTTTQRWLWAGVSAIGNDGGSGCFRALLQIDGLDSDGWEGFSTGWDAGGCRCLAHDGAHIYAGSLRRGVLVLAPDADDAQWRTPDVSCGLPLRDVSRLQPINALAVGDGNVLAAGPAGVYSSSDIGVSYRNCSAREFHTELPLPPGWVFCSDQHEIEIKASRGTE